MANVEVSLPAAVTVADVGQQGIRGLPGAAGTNGTNGSNGHTPQLWGGAPAPSTLHTDGDLFFGTTGDVYQQITGAWTGPIANIRGPSGGGGSSETTRRIRITDDNLGGLPSAPTWTVVVTSGGTHLQCTIPATAGDRIELYPNFMRVGSHFTDFVLLDNTGAISQYASTESSTPGPEGNPALYPSLSQEYVTTADMFTVASGHINAGSITIAMAHQGTGAGIIYAHPFYPWRLRLKNIGPEPA